MEHLAILSKNRKLLAKILDGSKTIESRWYKFKKTPYNNIKPGETIYFKNSGEPVTVKVKVARAIFFDNLNQSKIIEIFEKYGKEICIPISYAGKLAGKNYCTLIFLKDVQKIEPFNIDKKGYGTMAAWIAIDSIERIKRVHL